MKNFTKRHFLKGALVLLTLFCMPNKAKTQWTNNQAAAAVYGQTNFTSRTEGNTTNDYMVRPVSVAFSKNDRKIIIAQVTVENSTSHLYVYNDYTDAANANLNYKHKILLPDAATVNSIFVDENDNLWVGIMRTASNSAYNLFKYENASTLTSASLPVAKFKLSRYVSNGEDRSTYKPSIFVKSGVLFVADAANHVVARYDLSGFSNAGGEKYPVAYMGVIGDRGTHVGTSLRFNKPSQLTVDKNNDLWVADCGNYRVLKFANAFGFNSNLLPSIVLGRDTYTTANNANTNNNFFDVNGIASDGGGRLYVATTVFSNSKYGTKILVYNTNLFTGDSNNSNIDPVNVIGYSNISGNYNTHEATGYTAAKIFNGSNIAVNEHLFVTDYGWSRVTRFDPTISLPVTLKDFNVKGVAGKVNVTWATSAEVDADYYTVAVSTDGKNFKEVSKIQAKGQAATYSTSFDLETLALAGFGLLGLLLVPNVRNRWMRLAVIALTLSAFAACTKDQNFAGAKNGKTTYVKLQQVDKNGTVNDLGIKTVK